MVNRVDYRHGTPCSTPLKRRTFIYHGDKLFNKLFKVDQEPTLREPRVYTGELIGIDYLFERTGKALDKVDVEQFVGTE